LREHLRDTFWFVPTAAMMRVFVVWAVASEVDTEIVEALRRAHDYDTIADLLKLAGDAKAVVTAVSSAMMTFIGVVFSAPAHAGQPCDRPDRLGVVPGGRAHAGRPLLRRGEGLGLETA
jgi:hypothetical protein